MLLVARIVNRCRDQGAPGDVGGARYGRNRPQQTLVWAHDPRPTHTSGSGTQAPDHAAGPSITIGQQWLIG